MFIAKRLLVHSPLFKSARPILSLAGTAAAIAAVVVFATAIKTPRIHAGQENEKDREDSKVAIGFSIAPVPLKYAEQNRELVGLGSYIVNAQAECNGCHSRGPQTEYLATGNPYLLSPPKGPFRGMTQVNPATYLAGGRDFGPFPGLQHLYSRNLTPDKTGRAEGGRSFKEFLTTMRTGKDYDHLHPTCAGAPDGTCVLAPFNGDLLQVMPWPAYKAMTEHDIRAIYEYLSAIPCTDTVVAGAPVLRNDCH